MNDLTEVIAAALKEFSSPTVDRGDAHGARGQPGYIIWQNQIGFIAAKIADAILDKGRSQ
jgi:hypothetical protein